MMMRYSASTAGALTITFFLFLGMSALIAIKTDMPSEYITHGQIDIGPVKEPEQVKEKIKKPKKEIDQIKPIDLPKLKPIKPHGPVIGSENQPPMTPPTDDIGPKKGFGFAEGDFQAITKFKPQYPQGPLSRGLEGYVIVKFTVTSIGSVEDISIVETTHFGFNRAAIRAVSRYKYKPRVIDGQPVAVKGVMEKLSFELEEG